MSDGNPTHHCAGDVSPETQAALTEFLALLDELAQRGRRLRAAGYVPCRDGRAS